MVWRNKILHTSIPEVFPHDVRHSPLNLDNKHIIGRDSMNPQGLLGPHLNIHSTFVKWSSSIFLSST